MKTMEEKASEVTARWQELHPGGGPTSLSVADVRAAVASLTSNTVYRGPFRTLGPCPKCGSLNTIYNAANVYAQCRDCNAWWTQEDTKKGRYNTYEPSAKDFLVGAGKTTIEIEGAKRGNNNARLKNLKPPVTWYDNIAVGEKNENFEFQMWSVVPPQGCEITFFGEQAKDRAMKMAQLMLDDGKKK